MPDKTQIMGAIADYCGTERETRMAWTRELMDIAQRYTFMEREWPADALIHRSRSRVLTEFFEQTDAEVLFWIDADVKFSPGSVVRIIESARKTRGIVGGVVPKKFFGQGIAHRTLYNAPFTVPSDNLAEAVFVGSAFTAMHRDVPEKLAKTLPLATAGSYQYWPFCQPLLIDCEAYPGLKEDLSEDWALCYRWRAIGGKCWVDALPVCEHKGSHMYTLVDATQGRQVPDIPMPSQRPLKYIVLSTGHSGTGYLAYLLTSAGVPCGHESIFTRQGVAAQHALEADSSFHSVAYTDSPVFQGAKLIHLVRNPLKVIRSWYHAGTSDQNDKWARQFCEWPNGVQTPEKLAWRWVNWNKLIEERAPKAQVVRVEDRLGILDQLGLKPGGFDDPEYNAKPKARGKPEMTLADLGAAADAVREMATRYGYAAEVA